MLRCLIAFMGISLLWDNLTTFFSRASDTNSALIFSTRRIFLNNRFTALSSFIQDIFEEYMPPNLAHYLKRYHADTKLTDNFKNTKANLDEFEAVHDVVINKYSSLHVNLIHWKKFYFYPPWF